MKRNFKFLAVILLFLTGAGLAHALQCKSGSSSCSTSSASDCTNLGYSSSGVSNCKHYLLCPFNTNYKTCVAFDDSEPESDCSDYPLTECPEHGDCDECPDDNTYLKFTGCESGYQVNSAGNGCILSSCPDGYAKSAASCYNKGSAGWDLDSTDRYDSSDCYKCIAKSCPTGYSISVTKCGINSSAGYTFSTSGYSGDNACGKCECTAPCEDKITTKPDNSHFVTVICTACDESSEINDHWECDDGYVINSDKDGCIPSTCPDGYAKASSECSKIGSNTWYLDMDDRYQSSDCYACKPDDCASGYTDLVVSQCGSIGIGSSGWSVVEKPGVYSGDDKCYTCEKLACETGYSTDVTTCEDGYQIEAKGYSGDDECKKCVEKDCSTGYSKSITSDADCSEGYTFEQEKDNPLCGKCNVKPCETGYSTDVTTCEDGYQIETKGQSGEKPCNKCVEKDCSTGYSKDVTSCSAGYTFVKDDSNPLCGKCDVKPCGSVWVYKPDYSSGSESSGSEYVKATTGSSVEKCGGSAGWERVIVSGMYSGDDACYVCQRKSCPSGYITGRSDAADCGTGSSWTLDIHPTIKSGDDICSKCTQSCPSGSYATLALCKEADPLGCQFNTDTGCWKPRTLISGCLKGTYDTEEECINTEKVLSCTENRFGCWSPDSTLICLRGTYTTKEKCINTAKVLKCIQNSTGCWEPATPQCFYTLTKCPDHGTCDKCTDSSGTRYDLTSCDTNYYMSGTTCLSCADAYKTMKALNDKANNSYLNCCSGGVASSCRDRTTCSSVYKGSWNDGCIPTYAAIYDDYAGFKANCIKSIDDIADTITDFNTKCPNYKISNIVSSGVQCGSVVDRGNLAKPVEDGTENFGCAD